MSQINTITSLAITLFFIQGLAALNVTSPASDTVWNLQQDDHTVTWSTVSTDPSSFNVLLVNQNANCESTGMSKVIKENVSNSGGKIELNGIQGVKECGGYQINLVSTSNNGILAQSAPFHIMGSSSTTYGTNGQATDASHPVMKDGNTTQYDSAVLSNYSHGAVQAPPANTQNNQNISSQFHPSPAGNNNNNNPSQSTAASLNFSPLLFLSPLTFLGYFLY